MDELDEQLAQLKLMTSRALSPKNFHQQQLPPPHGSSGSNNSTGVAGRNHSPIGDNMFHQRQPSCSETLTKKIGPAVPPKPLKKVSGNVSTSGDEAPRRNQNNYSNMKMTLDNSVILDQQLEALEYHKRQLEKRSGNFPGPPPTSANYGVYTNVKSVPVAGNSLDNVVYSNIRYNSGPSAGSKEPASGPPTDQNQIVYSNVGFGVDFPPSPPLEIAALESTAPPPIDPISVDTSNFDYLQASNEDEDLPPPPSPVSSSYSELRRATDNFSQLAQYQPYTAVNSSASNRAASAQSHQQTQQPLPSHYQPQRPVDVGLQRQSVSTPRTTGHYPNDPQQIYANTQYQDVYSSFDPSSQATGDSNSSEYYGYGDLTQSLSNYESIYEPINPRPPSQLSSRSNYSLYTSYANGSQMPPTGSLMSDDLPSNSGNSSSNVGGGITGVAKGSNQKEVEVEALTNLLVHSMDSGSDIDSYGICVKCGERVVGESSGCTAMNQIYHIDCFTCSVCNVNLQGKPFYTFEGEPYCEVDYLNTLEKCSVCMKPILERILRATGKPYHPGCFCCVVCGHSLDGIPFTVDATNQNYCIEDFHKKFAPRCCVCQEPIMPEPGQEETVRVVALDRSFHFKCYKCEDCGLLLSSEAEGRGCYPLDDHILCKSCNAKRVQTLTSRMTTEL